MSKMSGNRTGAPGDTFVECWSFIENRPWSGPSSDTDLY